MRVNSREEIKKAEKDFQNTKNNNQPKYNRVREAIVTRIAGARSVKMNVKLTFSEKI